MKWSPKSLRSARSAKNPLHFVVENKRTEDPAHDAPAEDDMLLPLRAVHIVLTKIANVMQEEGKPVGAT